MGKIGIKVGIFGITVNFLLFLVKLYIGISSNSLSIYCDSINNLGDTLSSIIATVGFLLVLKLNDRKSKRVQSLAAFVIGLILAITGAYFAYNGVERLMYPVKISYSKIYALTIAFTILVKLIMGIVYFSVNRKNNSPVFKTLVLDSFLDCAITIAALMGLTLSVKLNFAIDSVISIVIGLAISISAIKSIVEQSKYLIND